MARESKAHGSPGKCASCGKGLPKAIKSKMEKCPHCGHALNTDSDAIDEGLPLAVARAAALLEEAVDARVAAVGTPALSAARAREAVRADQLLEVMLQEASAVVNHVLPRAPNGAGSHRVGDFEHLHPRDRIGRFMEKMAAKLRGPVKQASRRRGGRELSTLRGTFPHSKFSSAVSSPLRSLREAGHVAGDFEGLHPRDRLGRWMEKIGGLKTDQTAHIGGVSVRKAKGGRYEVTNRRGGKRTVRDPATAARVAHAYLGLNPPSRSVQHDNGNPGTPRGDSTAKAPEVNRDKPIQKIHDDYGPAWHEARRYADMLGRDVSLRKVNEFGKTRYALSALPSPDKRFGEDLKGEVVRPSFVDPVADLRGLGFRPSPAQQKEAAVRHKAAVAAAGGPGGFYRKHYAADDFTGGKQEGQGGHDARRNSGSMPAHDVGKTAGKTTGGKRKRLLREDQVKLLIATGTVETADEARILLDG